MGGGLRGSHEPGDRIVGVMGTYPMIPPSLSTERLLTVEMATVVAPTHSFAQRHAPIPLKDAENKTQLVLTDRSELTRGVDLGVQSRNTWRLSDLGAKHAFLIAGLGWGHMPKPMVANDLAGRPC